MVKRIAILLILIPAIIIYAYSPASASTQFRDLVAQAAILAEVDSGEILFSHNINRRHPADSLTRIMTLHLAVTAIYNGEIYENSLVEMTASAWEPITARNTTLNIGPGEVMPLIDLMHASFVAGAAEASNRLAEYVAGSVDAFILMMNNRAAELGAENTNFVNTDGLFNEAQFTTALDQFLIFQEAIGNELFLEIAGVLRHTISETNASDTRRITGTNSLLNQGGRYFFRHNKAGIASVTFEGGHSYAGISEADGLSLIAIILGSDEIMLPDESFDLRNLSEARRLFEWGYSQFGWRTILGTSDIVARAPITHGAGMDFVNLRPESEVRLLLDNDIPIEDFVRTVTIFSEERNEPLIAPVEAGDILGEITLRHGDEIFGPIPLLANTSVELHSFEFMRRQVMDILGSDTTRYVIWGLAVLILGYIALVIRYNVMRRKRVQRIAEAKRKLTEERRLAMEAQQEERRAYYGTSTRRGPMSDSGPYRGPPTKQVSRQPQRNDPRNRRSDY